MGTKELKKYSKEKHKKDSDSESDNTDSEHELGYYVNDRVKLMQEVLKLIKPKKIMSMAPNAMKDMQASAVKSLLLEELLGISKKRLQKILAGENLDYESSSSDSYDEKNNKNDADIEIISLDDISDDSEIFISDDNSTNFQRKQQEKFETINKSNRKRKHKKATEKVVIKKENDKERKKHKKKLKEKEIKKEPTEKESHIEEPVVNVLNLLELQARARAIRSQLANEIFTIEDKRTEEKEDNQSKETNASQFENKNEAESSSEDSSSSVIVLSPQNTAVIAIASNSEEEIDTKENIINKEPQPSTSKSTEKITDEKLTKEKVNSLQKSKNSKKRKKTTESIENDEDYNNDVLIVTEDITLEKDVDSSEKSKENPDTWKTRWLDSKKVKDVLKTTKLIKNIRLNRKQNAKKMQEEKDGGDNINKQNETKESIDQEESTKEENNQISNLKNTTSTIENSKNDPENSSKNEEENIVTSTVSTNTLPDQSEINTNLQSSESTENVEQPLDNSSIITENINIQNSSKIPEDAENKENTEIT